MFLNVQCKNKNLSWKQKNEINKAAVEAAMLQIKQNFSRLGSKLSSLTLFLLFSLTAFEFKQKVAPGEKVEMEV